MGMKTEKTHSANHYHNHQNKTKLTEKEIRFVGLPEVSNGEGGPDERDQNVQLPSDETSTRDVMYNMMTIVRSDVWCI